MPLPLLLLLCLLLLPASRAGEDGLGDGGCGADAYRLIDVDACSWLNKREIGFKLVNKSCAPANPADFSSTVACSWVPLSSRWGLAVSLMVLTGLCVNLWTLHKVVKSRRHPIMLASQPELCYGFAGGALIMTLAPMTYVSENTTAACVARVWMLYLPPTVMVSFLFAKVYLALVIFVSPSGHTNIRAPTDMNFYTTIKLY